MALQEPTKFACVQDVEMSGGTPIFPGRVGYRGRAMGRLVNRPSILLPFNCSGASMVGNAFFIVGWLLVLVLSLDRRFLLTLRR